MATNIHSLTALRGLAALTVLAFHCGARLFGGAENVPLPLSHGYLAVDLFFLLSGFVLMHVHEREFGEGIGWATIKSFFRARFARTYPIHIVTLLALLPMYGMQPEYSGVALAHNLLLTQAAWLGEVSWNFGAWSISAEWHAYLLFPFLVMPWRLCGRRATIAILSLCLVTLGLAAIASGDWGHNTHTPAVLLRCLPEFVAGMGLYRVYREGWLKRWMSGDAAVVASAIAVVALASIANADIAVIAALGCLLLTCAHNQDVAARVLTTPLPMFLGRISYSLYMVQAIASAAAYLVARPWLAHRFGGPLEAAIMLIVSFGVAIPLSRYIEYPMRDWLRGRSVHMLAAVDGQRRAGDEAAFVGHQK